VTHSWFGEPRVKDREIAGDGVGACSLPRAPTGDALQASSTHQQLDLVVPDLDPATQGEFGVHSQDAVGAVGLQVDLGDQVGQHRVAHRPFRWCSASLLVEPRLRDAKHPAGNLNWSPFRGDHFDRREPTFGLVSSLSRSTARCAIASSFSSSENRFLAAASSPFSRVLKPGTSPRSMRSCLRHE